MKKILIYITLFVVAFVFAWFLFGYINKSNVVNTSINLLQQTYETDLQKEGVVLTRKLVSDDIRGYYNGKNSVYGAVVNIIDYLEKSQNEYKDVNIKYLKIVADDLECIGRSNPKYCGIQRIVVYDDEYAHLLNETKNFIGIINNSLTYIMK